MRWWILFLLMVSQASAQFGLNSAPFLGSSGNFVWYNPNWSLRSVIVVTNSGTNVLVDWPVSVTLSNTFNWASAQTDGSDIRFTDSTKTNLIPFWIESWTNGSSAVIWTRVPFVAAASQTNIYIYWNNPAPTITTNATSPIGIYTKATNNPIVTTGAKPRGLAENLVYDTASGHYYLVIQNIDTNGITLFYSDTPTNPASWTWTGTNVTSGVGVGQNQGPFLVYATNKWYLFYGKVYGSTTLVVSEHSTDIGGPYTGLSICLSNVVSTWEAERTSEPYVFQRDDGVWVMFYMGDAGSLAEQIGYATASSVDGPWTKYAGNPVLAFGPPGSSDEKAVCDPWVVKFGDTYYIGYASSPTTANWETSYAITKDFVNFFKGGILLSRNLGNWDTGQAFRGGVTLVGGQYIFPYVGGAGTGVFTNGIATLAASNNIVNNPNAVFTQFDNFDGTALRTNVWSYSVGGPSQVVVSGGFATLTATATYIKIYNDNLPTGSMVEMNARHTNGYVNGKNMETGLSSGGWSRILDGNATNSWSYQASDVSGLPIFNMGPPAVDTTNHILRVGRYLSNNVFQVDSGTKFVLVTNAVSDWPPIVMTFGNPSEIVVDWYRARKFTYPEPVATFPQ